MKTDIYGFTDEERELMEKIFRSVPHIERVLLYGSRAKGTFKEFSDVDITLFGSQLTHDDLLDVCERLDESNLPYFYDVSIFCKLTDAEFISHIKRVGKWIYARDNAYQKTEPLTDQVADQQLL